MLARLLVGLDGGVQADVALEQAIVLARRLGSAITVGYVHEPGRVVDPALGARAVFRIAAARLEGRLVERDGEAGAVLAELGRGADGVLVGRGRTAPGRRAAALARDAARCVVSCAGVPSPLRVCAVALDGGDSSVRALRVAARVAAAPGGVLHLIHAAPDAARARDVTAPVEEQLSREGVAFHTHVRAGRPAEVLAALARELRADVLFIGAPASDARSTTEDILTHVSIPVVVHP